MAIIVSGCAHKNKEADIVVHNANIYKADAQFTKGRAMAITDGKIVEIGAEQEIRNKYRADEFIDMRGLYIYPLFYSEKDTPIEDFVSLIEGAGDYPMDRKDALLTLTAWEAKNRYEEDKKGSLTKGKEASFMVLNGDIMKVDQSELSNLKVEFLYKSGEQTYP